MRLGRVVLVLFMTNPEFVTTALCTRFLPLSKPRRPPLQPINKCAAIGPLAPFLAMPAYAWEQFSGHPPSAPTR
jgi:hypothetical protein